MWIMWRAKGRNFLSFVYVVAPSLLETAKETKSKVIVVVVVVVVIVVVE